MIIRRPVRGLALGCVLASGALVGCGAKQQPVVAQAVTPPAVQAMPQGELEPGPAAVAAQLRARFERVYFGFDRADINPDSRALLTENAAILARYPNVRVEVEGHADHFGTTEYNMALGERRASSVAKLLATLGVGPAQLKVVSFGEERARVNATDRAATAGDRRVEFRVFSGTEVAESSYEDGSDPAG